MAEQGYILGIDLGTTSLKGVLYDLDGQILAADATVYPTHRFADGRVEQDAWDWLESFWSVADRIMAGRAPADIRAIGVCSQVNTYVFVDGDGVPLAPAIVWQDVRAAEQACRLDAMISEPQRRRWWPSGMAVSASHMLPQMAYMAASAPDIWARTVKVLSPKDFLLRHLTGMWTADPLAAFDLVDTSGTYIDALMTLVPGARERVAPLAPFRAVIGHLRHPHWPDCAAAVVNGTMDAFGCLFGSGAARPGEGSYISGTSEIIALIGDRPGGYPGIVSFAAVDGWHVQAGPTQSGGDTLRWMAALFDMTHQDVLDRATLADRSGNGDGVLFLPHLEGERAPLWDARARGAFIGMNSHDAAPQLALAALEGVALSARLVLDGAAKAVGGGPEALYLGGTGNRSDLWAQIRADVLGIPLHRVECLDTGAVGAAIMAGIGIGHYRSIAEASSALVRVERTFRPDPEKSSRYLRMMSRYMAAYRQLKALEAI
jgi:xylulokinase